MINVQNSKDKSSVLGSAVQTLRKRARLARCHAEKLLSETTAQSFLQWTLKGPGLSRGKDSYLILSGLSLHTLS
jgi:hypothetical protein